MKDRYLLLFAGLVADFVIITVLVFLAGAAIWLVTRFAFPNMTLSQCVWLVIATRIIRSTNVLLDYYSGHAR